LNEYGMVDAQIASLEAGLFGALRFTTKVSSLARRVGFTGFT
jgi:hypothetical protein